MNPNYAHAADLKRMGDRHATTADLDAYRALNDGARLEQRLAAQMAADRAEQPFRRAWLAPVLTVITFTAGLTVTLLQVPALREYQTVEDSAMFYSTLLVCLLAVAGGVLYFAGGRYETRLANARTWVTGYAEMETRIAAEQTPVRRRRRR